MKAFPQPVATVGDKYHAGDELVEGAGGMSLRDYFAGQALTGIMANPLVQQIANAKAADAAYILADYMLISRAK